MSCVGKCCLHAISSYQVVYFEMSTNTIWLLAVVIPAVIVSVWHLTRLFTYFFGGLKFVKCSRKGSYLCITLHNKNSVLRISVHSISIKPVSLRRVRKLKVNFDEPNQGIVNPRCSEVFEAPVYPTVKWIHIWVEYDRGGSLTTRRYLRQVEV